MSDVLHKAKIFVNLEDDRWPNWEGLRVDEREIFLYEVDEPLDNARCASAPPTAHVTLRKCMCVRTSLAKHMNWICEVRKALYKAHQALPSNAYERDV